MYCTHFARKALLPIKTALPCFFIGKHPFAGPLLPYQFVVNSYHFNNFLGTQRAHPFHFSKELRQAIGFIKVQGIRFLGCIFTLISSISRLKTGVFDRCFGFLDFLMLRKWSE